MSEPVYGKMVKEWKGPGDPPKLVLKFNPDTPHPNAKVDDIIGQKDAKQLLRIAFSWPTKQPKLFQSLIDNQVQNSVLVFGPVLTGKTTLVFAAARESGIPFVKVNAADLYSKWIGDSEERVKELFKQCSEYDRCLIIIHHIEGLVGNKNHCIDHQLSFNHVFEQEMKKSWGRVVVVGITSEPDQIEDSFLRLFKPRIWVGLPKQDERILLFKHFVGKYKNTISEKKFIKLGKESQGYNGRDIELVVRTAFFEAVQAAGGIKSKLAHETAIISKKHLLKAYCSSPPSYDHKEILNLEKMRSEFEYEVFN